MKRMERALANFQGEEDDVEAALYKMFFYLSHMLFCIRCVFTCHLLVIHFRAATISQ